MAKSANTTTGMNIISDDVIFVLVQPEMERGRSPLVSIPPYEGGDF